MDYDKYYIKKSDGSYSIHFVNYKGFDKKTIEKIFSAYGNVLSIEATGDDYGLRFIRYKTVDEVEKCLEDLQQRKTVKILPQKIKQQQAHQQDNHSPLYNKNDNKKSVSKLKKYSSQENNASSSSYSSDQDKSPTTFTNVAFFNDGDLDSSPNYHRHYFDTRFHTSKGKWKKDEKSTDFLDSQNNVPKKSIDGDIPGLINEEKCSQDGSVSHSVTPIPLKTETLLAQDVIVGNVHQDYGIHYILHMFEQHSPISVSLMKTLPNTGVRYCHVYFKTVQDALAVEQKFDKYDLCGKHLIVLRCVKLIEEASAP